MQATVLATLSDISNALCNIRLSMSLYKNIFY